jgi:hypothetical protein
MLSRKIVVCGILERSFDFTVDDHPEGMFFKFYGELYMAMPNTVDLIDLSGKMTKFKSIVAREAKLIYQSPRLTDPITRTSSSR